MKDLYWICPYESGGYYIVKNGKKVNFINSNYFPEIEKSEQVLRVLQHVQAIEFARKLTGLKSIRL
jgi:hypothetical protein